MVILGLTGSIAMGKSTAAAMFRRLGVPVHDADRTVHALFSAGGGAVRAIAKAFPGVVGEQGVDREALARRVYDDRAALHRLEAIIHPRVYTDQREFLARQARNRRSLVVLDVPLLFETGGGRICDAVCVVSAPRFIQVQRLMKRPGMTRRRIDAILARQMPDTDKRRRADFVIRSGLGFAFMRQEVHRIVTVASTWTGSRWSPSVGSCRASETACEHPHGVCQRRETPS